jgi:parallel beta-helix repeat protein
LRKNVSAIMLFLLLVSTLTLAFKIQPVKAEGGTIYIRADGSVDPPTAPIRHDGNIYTFTADIYNDSIVVQRDNIVIDGKGYTLEGSGSGEGMDISERTNITIKNVKITNFFNGIRHYVSFKKVTSIRISGNTIANNYYGVILSGSSNAVFENSIMNNVYGVCLWCTSSTISGNNLENNAYYGIGVEQGGSSNTISVNNITNNGRGLYLWGSPYNTVSRNNIINNWFGIYLQQSSDNTISENSFVGCGLFLYAGCYSNVVIDNLVNGKPLIYLEGVSNRLVSGDVGQVLLVNCTNIRVEKLNISDTTVGVQLHKTGNTEVIENRLKANSYCGITLWSSPNNILAGNNLTANSYNGIYLMGSSNNTITENSVTATRNYGKGICLSFSSNNTISGNNITKNNLGILIEYSENNLVYHNDFVNNTQQVRFFDDSANVWDDDYPSGGNYWSDYTDLDLYSGPYQNESGSDGIWDHPYAVDRYPLVNPWTPTPPPPTVWVEVYGTGSSLAIRQTHGLEGEVLKRVPDGWVLKVIDTHGNSVVKDGKTWWEIKDVTDGIEGWSASEFLKEGDQEELIGKTKRLDTAAERILVILEAVDHYYNDISTTPSLYSSNDLGTNNNLTIFKKEDCPIELILAIISQETGPRYNYSNEVSNGDGIMQVIDMNKGWGSGLKCYTTDCKYYTNTPQGIYANIKDGLRVLQWALETIKFNDNYKKYCSEITETEIKSIGAVWKYNGEGVPDYLAKYENDILKGGIAYQLLHLGDDDYLGNYSAHLSGDALSKEKLQKWSEKFECAQKNKQYIQFKSPGEIRIYDLEGRVTGLVNGEVREEIPNSIFNKQNNLIGILFSDDFYVYEVVGKDEGTYGLEIAFIEDGKTTTFTATAIPTSANVIHQYTIDWDALSRGEEGVTVQVDSEGDGVFEHTFTSDGELTQSEFLAQTAPPTLSVSISPLSASILVGQSVTFTSTVSGGYTPYSYQWYLNGAPVSGATSNTWTFTPTTGGIYYYVHLKVTDAKANTAQSDTARITVATVPVGGYSFPIQVQTRAEPVLPYIALIATLTAVFTKLRPKTKRKH